MIRNLNWYIRKYGEIEGNDRFLNRKNTINTLEWYIDKHGEEEGLKRYNEKNKRVGERSVNRNTKSGFIERYGEEEGERRYTEFLLKSKHTKEKYMEIYGTVEGEKKWAKYVYNKKITSRRSIEYWLKVFDGDYELANESLIMSQSRGEKFYVDKFGETIGLQKWENRKNDQSHKISQLMTIKENRNKHILSEDNFILKYGIELGKEKWKQYLKNRKNFRTTYEEFINKHGEDIGNQKWKEHIYKIVHKSSYVSKVSQELFDSLHEALELKDDVYYGSLNKEYFLYDENNKKINYYDFTMTDIKLIIEFNGDFWHANPHIYSEDFYHPILKKTAAEIWEMQEYKNNLAKCCGYDIIEVWESDYRKDKICVINDCLNKIKNKKYERNS
jgi:hypothetical protein